MCGRFGITATAAELAKLLEAEWIAPEPPLPRYNVAPTQDVPVLRQEEGRRVLDVLRWGLVPSWAKDPSIGNRMINARAETVAEKPAYRTALAKRRCLVPASGFYEWQAAPGGKIPHWIHPRDGESLLTLAGLWEVWRRGPDAPWMRSFTILTTSPSDDVSALHDRMPVVLAGDAREAWLDPATPVARAADLLRAAPAGTLAAWPVSTAVNRPQYDGPELILPEAPEERA